MLCLGKSPIRTFNYMDVRKVSRLKENVTEPFFLVTLISQQTGHDADSLGTLELR